jgi:hypothetical protein
MKRNLHHGARQCLSVAVLSFALAAQADIRTGLLGHWAFNETSGTTAADTSGKGNTASVGNQFADDPQWSTGQVGGALTFRGPELGGDHAIVPNLPALTNTFSVSAWVWADPRDGTWPESAIVRSSGITAPGPLSLVIRLKNRDQAFGPLGSTTVNESGQASAVNETVGFPVSSWQHVAVVGDGTTNRLYRNGALVGAAAYTPPLGAALSPEFGIGVTPDDGGFPGTGFWQGKIDDVGIWNVALTPAQVASVFAAGLAGKSLLEADAYQETVPVITTHPVGAARFVGETVSFSVQASGSGTLAYQWKLNGTAIQGATQSTYRIDSVKTSDAGQYTVEVSNSAGSKTSDPATLTVQEVSLQAGLLGYWKFDETQGEVAADSTTNGLNATFGNSLGDNSQWAQGKIGGALAFGGSELQQFAYIPDYPKPASTITVALWVYVNTLGGWTSFVKNWGSTDAGQFHFGLGPDGQFENIYIKQADGKTPNTSDTQVFPTESWQHVAFVCDGSKVRIYRNGVEVASTDYDGTLVIPPMACIGLGVKMANDCTLPDTGAAGWLNGRLDDLAIWNRGLFANEILAIYQAGLNGKGAMEANTAQVFPPAIESQPASVSVFEGTPVNLTVAASGTPPLIFQWFKNGQAVLGATNTSLDLGLATSSIAGTYRVNIRNQGGETNTADATVTVGVRPLATLISEWKFEDNLNDSSGTGNEGTAMGSVEYVPGMAGKAIRLAKGNPVVKEGAVGLPLGATNSWSMNLWVRLSEAPTALAYLGGFGPVMSVGAGTARGLLAFEGPQNNGIYVWGNSLDTSTGVPYPLNRWAMITISHDGSDGRTQVYLDGVLIGQNIRNYVDVPEGENRISLAPTSNWTVDVAGDFDEFTIWNGAMGPGQIQSLYTAAKPAMTAMLSGSNIVITWPAAATGFVLESASAPNGPTWTEVPGVTGNSATIAVGTSNQYFRLRK